MVKKVKEYEEDIKEEKEEKEEKSEKKEKNKEKKGHNKSNKKEKRVDMDKKEKKEEKEEKEEKKIEKNEDKKEDKKETEEKKEENKIVLETSTKEEFTIYGNKETKANTTTTQKNLNEKKYKEDEIPETKEAPQQLNNMFYPFINPGKNGNTTFQMPIPMPMSMPMNTPAKEGDKNSPQQPLVCMVPVMFIDPSKLPKEMQNKGNMSFPYFPFPMNFQQTTPETK